MISVASERAAEKKWQAARYVIVWFVRDFAGPPKVRLTLEHASPFEIAKLTGWVEKRPGRWQKTVALADLSDEMAAVGRAYQEDACDHSGPSGG